MVTLPFETTTMVCQSCRKALEDYTPLGEAVCAECRAAFREAGYLDDARDLAASRRIANSGVPPLLGQATFDGFRRRKGTALALDAMRGYSARWPEQMATADGILLTGPVGTGKSHLAAALTLHVAKTHRARMEKVPSLMRRLAAAYDPESQETQATIFRRLREADLLVLDDIGAQRWTEAREEWVFEIVDSRVDGRKPLVVTSNLPPDDLVPLVGLRTVDRIVGACMWVDLKGATSYRQERAERRVVPLGRDRG